MKSSVHKTWVICGCFLLAVGCAQGELETPATGDDAGQSGEDASGDEDGRDDGRDASDRSSTDGGTDGDSGRTDADGDADAGPPESCEEVTCEEGVCDPDTLECVECVSDDDCSEGLCHDDFPVCVPDCCDETTQDGFVDLGYIHNRYDIGVTGGGEPRLVVGNDDDEVLQYALPVDGSWLSEDIAQESAATSSNIRMALDADGDPHVAYAEYERLVYYWREDGDWKDEELIVEEDDPGYTDIAVDEDGTVHIMSLLNYGDDLLYVTRQEDGGAEENFAFPEEDGAVWINLDTTSDGRPVASFYVGTETELIVAELSDTGDWEYETVSDDSSQLHAMAVGPDDEPVIAYHRSDNDGLRLLSRDGDSWDDEMVVDETDYAYSPDIAVDELGDPHVVYTVSTDDGSKFEYLRWNGHDWQTHRVDSVESATYPRVVLDDQRIAHAVTRDSARDAVTYIRLD